MELDQVSSGLDTIGERIARARQRVQAARDQLASAQSELAAMPTEFSALLSAIDAGATANAGNAAWEYEKAKKDIYVADFQTLKSEVDGLVTAINA